MKYEASKIESITIEGVDTKDYPDFCDAYVYSCIYDGRELTDDELDELQEEQKELIYEYILDTLW